jgi:hypothetical protein
MDTIKTAISARTTRKYDLCKQQVVQFLIKNSTTIAAAIGATPDNAEELRFDTGISSSVFGNAYGDMIKEVVSSIQREYGIVFELVGADDDVSPAVIVIKF